MVMDNEAKALVQQLVAALQPFGNMVTWFDKQSPLSVPLNRPFPTHGEAASAATAIAAAEAALASATNP